MRTQFVTCWSRRCCPVCIWDYIYVYVCCVCVCVLCVVCVCVCPGQRYLCILMTCAHVEHLSLSHVGLAVYVGLAVHVGLAVYVGLARTINICCRYTCALSLAGSSPNIWSKKVSMSVQYLYHRVLQTFSPPRRVPGAVQLTSYKGLAKFALGLISWL